MARRQRTGAGGDFDPTSLGFPAYVSQTAGQMPTLISLVDSGMGISILPASAVKNSVASVVACEIAGTIPRSKIAIAINKGNRAAIVGSFRSLALDELGRGRRSVHANGR